MRQTIYEIDVHFDLGFAYPGLRGPWICPEPPPVCPECGVPREVVGSPIQIEWEPGSDHIADFCKPGFTKDLLVTQRVRDYLEPRFEGLSFGPVEMIQNPRLKRPETTSRRRRPRVWLPYEGPPLWRMNYTVVGDFDFRASQLKVTRRCETCGYWRIDDVRSVVPVSASIGDADIFGMKWLEQVFFFTEKGKTAVEEMGFTNIHFEPIGHLER
jgi:hypothetical protein